MAVGVVVVVAVVDVVTEVVMVVVAAARPVMRAVAEAVAKAVAGSEGCCGGSRWGWLFVAVTVALSVVVADSTGQRWRVTCSCPVSPGGQR